MCFFRGELQTDSQTSYFWKNWEKDSSLLDAENSVASCGIPQKNQLVEQLHARFILYIIIIRFLMMLK